VKALVAALFVAATAAWGCASSPGSPEPLVHPLAAPSAVAEARPSLREVTALALGFEHSCAVLSEGSLYCWGSNSSQQITGELQRYPRPVRVAGIGPVLSLAAGTNGTCVAERSGDVRCWGGAFASRTRSKYEQPFLVDGASGLRSLSMRGQHACGLGDDGRIFCWGDNDEGQLGDGTKEDRDDARPVSGLSGATAVSAGMRATAAVSTGGSVWIWGDDHAVAPAPPSDSPNGVPTLVPRKIEGIDDAVEIALTNTMGCARKRDGRVACWGDLPAGRLVYERSTTPVVVEGLAAVRQLVAGAQHVCALLADDTVACWGVVPGWHVWRAAPMQIEGVSGAAAIAAGSFHQCALRRDGEVLCWGDDGAGQLGDGERAVMSRPVQLRW
jgi:alpha-tubulin suppressor-like RCC1 family protein